MRCVKCKRVTLKPAKVVETANGPEGWGPVCARKAFPPEPRSPGHRRITPARHEDDPQQIELELTQ